MANTQDGVLKKPLATAGTPKDITSKPASEAITMTADMTPEQTAAKEQEVVNIQKAQERVEKQKIDQTAATQEADQSKADQERIDAANRREKADEEKRAAESEKVQDLKTIETDKQEFLGEMKAETEEEGALAEERSDKEIAAVEEGYRKLEDVQADRETQLKAQADEEALKQKYDAMFDIDRKEASDLKEERDKIANQTFDENIASAETAKLTMKRASAERMSILTTGNARFGTGTWGVAMIATATAENAAYENEVEAAIRGVVSSRDAALDASANQYTTAVNRLNEAERNAIDNERKSLETAIYNIQMDEAKTSMEKQRDISNLVGKKEEELKLVRQDVRNMNIAMYESYEASNREIIAQKEKEVQAIQDKKDSASKEVNMLYDQLIGAGRGAGRNQAILDVQRGLDNGTYASVQEGLQDVTRAIKESSYYKGLVTNNKLPQDKINAMEDLEMEIQGLQRDKLRADIGYTQAQQAKLYAAGQAGTDLRSDYQRVVEGLEIKETIGENGVVQYEVVGGDDNLNAMLNSSAYRMKDDKNEIDWDKISKQYAVRTGYDRDEAGIFTSAYQDAITGSLEEFKYGKQQEEALQSRISE